MHALCRTLNKVLGDAWYCLLKPTASYLSIGDRGAVLLGQEGLATPTVPGMDHPLVAPPLEEFADMFSDLAFPPDVHIAYNIDLIDPVS